ncbi:MAG: MliC family protein [Chromatiales bacterium]|nr:MliC family protein [Chromatiales bacterium]
MRISNLFSAAAASAALLVAAPVLAGEASASAEWRQVAYSCESGQELTVAYRESGSAVQVQAADRPAVKLISRPAKAGFRYGDSRHELRGDGEAVTWRIGNKTPVRCTSGDPAAQNLAAAATR